MYVGKNTEIKKHLHVKFIFPDEQVFCLMFDKRIANY